jgi:UrcA family protein
VLVIAASAVFAPSAFAQGEGETRQVRVTYADLDLSQPSDAQRLYNRLRRATAYVCATPASSVLHRYDRACRDATLDQAVADLNNPALAAIHSDRVAPRRPMRIASAT